MSTEISKVGGALAIRPDQSQWTDRQAAVLRQSGISNDVTAAELAGFLHLCQRTGLDPFSRQIYLIGRKDKRAGRVVYTPQTGIDGYRVVARRATAKSGGTYGYEDTLWCDPSGRWRDVWLADAPPAAVKVTVLRDGMRFSAVALYREYVQTGWEGQPVGLWGKMPASQLAKCAEALALRKAFPHDLAGVYTAEEMAQAESPADGERRLRTVRPGDGDPWVADGEGRSQRAQDLADVAAQVSDRGAVQDLYRQARDEGLLAETVKTPDGALLELGAYLIARGQQLAEPAPQPDEDGVPDADAVSQPATAENDADAAVQELRAAAAKVGLDNLDEEFERSYGLPIARAGASQLRQMTAILTGSASAA